MIQIPMTVAVQGAIPASVTPAEESIRMHMAAEYTIGGQKYAGPYEFIPGDEAQTIAVQDRYCAEDITIGPIPSNYGKITYNGSVITVS